jgi:hypothetical protein
MNGDATGMVWFHASGPTRICTGSGDQAGVKVHDPQPSATAPSLIYLRYLAASGSRAGYELSASQKSRMAFAAWELGRDKRVPSRANLARIA